MVEATYAYQTIRGTSYEEIAELANQLGRQGWRLLPPVYGALDASSHQRVLLAVMEKCDCMPALDQETLTQPAGADFRSPVPLAASDTRDFLTRTSLDDR